jgi:DNA-binding PadR family transcriptional regulator
MAGDDTLSKSAFLILLSLSDRSRHGLGIIARVEESSAGEVRMGPGTLYGTLQKLTAAGLIKEQRDAPDPDDHDTRRRYYALTPRGARALKSEALRMRALVKAAAKQNLFGGL